MAAQPVERPEPDWADPGLFTVAPGVHRIPLPLPGDGLRAVNVYAIEADGGLVLIDGGWALADSLGLLEAALAQAGAGLADITRCLVTHAHRDHYTQAVTLRRRFGTRVAVGIGERPTLELVARPDAGGLTVQLDRLRRCGAEQLARSLRGAVGGMHHDPAEWEQPDEWVEGPVTIPVGGRELLAVPTPGHTQGHLVFADTGRGLLFAGDHVLPRITPSVGFEAVVADQPLGDFLSSLRRMLELPDLRLLPAHGPVTQSTHARVHELLAHHETRLEACLAQVIAGQGTAYEAARALPWTRRQRRFAELDLFNQMLAVFETAVHLDLLCARGQLRRRHAGGQDSYSAAG